MRRISARLALLLSSLLLAGAPAVAQTGQALKYLPVQDAGRIKPFDTFAREALQLVHGKQTYKGKPATDIVMTWMLIPDHWSKEKIFQVRHNGLREALKLADQQEIYHSAEELMLNERLSLLIQELKTKQESKEKLDPYFQAIQTLNNQLTLFHAVRTGQALRVVPPAPDVKPSEEQAESPMASMITSLWTGVAGLQGETRAAFEEITKAFVAELAADTETASGKGRELAENGATSATLTEAVGRFMDKARAVNPAAYAEDVKIRTEVHYNDFHPFKWAWIVYLVAAVFLVAHWINGRKVYYSITWVALLAGFLLHAYGMGVRAYLTGRPPVSNMYETVIWVPWVAMLFAMVLEWIYRTRIVLLAASLVAGLCLILSDLSPVVLDGSLQPLEPVLRDNFWLITHVIVIVSSYGAFFLAFAMGDLLLWYYFRDEKKYAKQIQEGVNAIYRSLQIGVVLLAAGTILGGVWADYSWGRFWGWDPKETWAFIALMGYLALLHGRLAGWVRGFGMAAGSVIAFSLVIMAWYGVNFVLGAGLHTYGFGAGGVEYVSAFVALHILYVAYVATVRHSRLKASAPETRDEFPISG